jgi:hypothetical protein
MRHLAFEPARPLDTGGMPWIPTGPGKSFRPLRFAANDWSGLMRLEPGSTVALHRHTGEVHAVNLAGTREIVGTGERAGPGNDVYEPAGTVDGWERSVTGHVWCTSRWPVSSSTSVRMARSPRPSVRRPSGRSTWLGAGSTVGARPGRSLADQARPPGAAVVPAPDRDQGGDL